MAVYFVYRCHYMGPTEKHLKRFDDATVLEWFRNRWKRLADADDAVAYARVKEELGCAVYSFHRVFRAIAEDNVRLPRTILQLVKHLREHVYGGTVDGSTHAIQGRTDDDELEMAYYFFDDHYLKKHGKLAAFLLHEDWKLPADAGAGEFEPAEKTKQLNPDGNGEGTTYLVHMTYYDSGNLSDFRGVYTCQGIRLPALARHLLRATPTAGFPFQGGWPLEPRLLRASLTAADQTLPEIEQTFLREVRASPAGDAAWNAYSDWLMDQGQPGAGLVLLERGLRQVAWYPVVTLGGGSWEQLSLGPPESAEQELKDALGKLRGNWTYDSSRSLVRVDEHIAQLCLHTQHWGRHDLYHQWIYFDDLWASAHPDLANAVLRFASRWDVLTSD
jgi:uncharacterized protein (TIGR02996 family)